MCKLLLYWKKKSEKVLKRTGLRVLRRTLFSEKKPIVFLKKMEKKI